jgi:hypothetical protein
MWHCTECGDRATLACVCGSTLCVDHAGSLHATPPTVINGRLVDTDRRCAGSQRAERNHEAIVMQLATVPAKPWDLAGYIRL